MKKTKIKICGLFRLCDTDFVNEAMPDYVGFVFYEKSHRYITLEQAENLRQKISSAIKTVGVFVNASYDEIEKACFAKIIDVVQLHGDEDGIYLAGLRKKIPNIPIWQAFRIHSKEDVQLAMESTADMVLLDNGKGTGNSFDWSFLDEVNRPYILAGGLNPEKIAQAVSRFHPDVIDISSGVESAGVKDKEKIFKAVTMTRIE